MEQTLLLALKENSLHFFFPLFQQGVIIKTPLGRNVKDLLSLHLEIPPEYVRDRIQTIFLDGKAVDDLEKTAVRDGSTLALSAAMPGLVGATLRKGGFFSSLRQAITFSGSTETIPQQEGRIILKLFNMLVPELGPHFLAKGIWLEGKDLNRFLEGLEKNFWEGCREISKNNQQIYLPFDRKELYFENDRLVFFKVKVIPLSDK